MKYGSKAQKIVDSFSRGSVVELDPLEVVRGPHGPFYHGSTRMQFWEPGSDALSLEIDAGGLCPWDWRENEEQPAGLLVLDTFSRKKLSPALASIFDGVAKDAKRMVDVRPVPYALALVDDGRPLAPFDTRVVEVLGDEVTWKLSEYTGLVLAWSSGRIVGVFRVLGSWAGLW